LVRFKRKPLRVPTEMSLTLDLLVVFFAFQRYFVQGLLAGSVK
jgi:ABC-type glycerol-3-phosphate transport system permease component